MDGLTELARDYLPEAVELRRELHRQPELGLENPLTQRAVLDQLADLPLEVTTGDTVTSVTAELAGATDGPTVLLRGDMDALPMPEDSGEDFSSQTENTMHACGHDAHTSMLVAAAHLLSSKRDEIAGRVRFMFQPGEEGHHGARFMIEEGVTAGIERAFALHVISNLPAGLVVTKGGPMLASADSFVISVRGRGGHASMPHNAADPIPVACEIVTAIQTWVTRRVDVFRPGVITVGNIHAGTTDNVIPETAVLEGTIRAVDADTRTAMHDALGRLSTHIAQAHDMTAEVVITDGFPVTVNDDEQATWALGVARDLLGPERVIESPSPVMGPRTSATSSSACRARWSSSAPARTASTQPRPRPTTRTGCASTSPPCPPASPSTAPSPWTPSHLGRDDDPALHRGVELAGVVDRPGLLGREGEVVAGRHRA